MLGATLFLVIYHAEIVLSSVNIKPCKVAMIRTRSGSRYFEGCLLLTKRLSRGWHYRHPPRHIPARFLFQLVAYRPRNQESTPWRLAVFQAPLSPTRQQRPR